MPLLTAWLSACSRVTHPASCLLQSPPSSHPVPNHCLPFVSHKFLIVSPTCAPFHLSISPCLPLSASLPPPLPPHHLAGVYKRHEARLTLLRYQTRALAHSSLSRITDESWAMDGFVSISKWSVKLPDEDTPTPPILYFLCPLLHSP